MPLSDINGKGGSRSCGSLRLQCREMLEGWRRSRSVGVVGTFIEANGRRRGRLWNVGLVER